MVNRMTEKTALVHQMPFTSDRSGFAANLEKIYFGTAQSRIYLAADFIRVNCHTGMSALIRKSVLDEQGGLKAFSCYLAEDFFISKSFLDRGWKVCISSHPALQNSGVCDVSSFQARLTRYCLQQWYSYENLHSWTLKFMYHEYIQRQGYLGQNIVFSNNYVNKNGKFCT